MHETGLTVHAGGAHLIGLRLQEEHLLVLSGSALRVAHRRADDPLALAVRQVAHVLGGTTAPELESECEELREPENVSGHTWPAGMRVLAGT